MSKMPEVSQFMIDENLGSKYKWFVPIYSVYGKTYSALSSYYEKQTKSEKNVKKINIGAEESGFDPDKYYLIATFSVRKEAFDYVKNFKKGESFWDKDVFESLCVTDTAKQKQIVMYRDLSSDEMKTTYIDNGYIEDMTKHNENRERMREKRKTKLEAAQNND